MLRQAALLLSTTCFEVYTDLWSIREKYYIDYSPTGKNVGEDSCPDLKSYRTSSRHKVIDVFWCFLFVLSSQNVYVGFLAVSSRIYLIKIDKNQPFIAHVDKYTYSAPWDLSKTLQRLVRFSQVPVDRLAGLLPLAKCSSQAPQLRTGS